MFLNPYWIPVVLNEGIKKDFFLACIMFPSCEKVKVLPTLLSRSPPLATCTCQLSFARLWIWMSGVILGRLCVNKIHRLLRRGIRHIFEEGSFF